MEKYQTDKSFHAKSELALANREAVKSQDWERLPPNTRGAIDFR